MKAVTDRILSDGPITFAEFMRLALYDPDEGFYARRVPGAGTGYRTSPSLSEWFGRLFARWAASVWDELGRPDPFTVIEAGAGRADLAAVALEAFSSEAGGPLRWAIVEPFDAVAARQRERLADWGSAVTWRRSLRDGPRVTGCVVANEVLDNQPVHLLEKADGYAVEISVGLEDGQLVEVRGPISEPVLAEQVAAALPHLEDGDRFEVSPGASAWVCEAGDALDRGVVLVIDYGDDEPDLWRRRPGGTLVTYRDEGLGVDLLVDPGQADITAHVNFSALARAAVAAGLRPEAPRTQRAWLQTLGAAEVAESLRRGQEEAELAGDHAAMVQLLAERSRLTALSARGGLGDLLVFSAKKS